MAYSMDFSSEYTADSQVVEAKCNSCKEVKLVQELPAELNAGEFFSVDLCKTCLLDLAAEL